MTPEEALAFVEQRLYAKTGKHLNNLERDVFKGSWQDNTYQEIYPQKPEYVERTVAYRLWQKLSIALGERVTKRHLRGIVERACQQRRHVFISYRGQNPDQAIATTLSEKLKLWGYQIFTSDLDTLLPMPSTVLASTASEDTLAPTLAALGRCDCFVLLLSPQMALSEMAIEQLRQLRQAVGRQGTPLPQQVVIRLDPTQPLTLVHDLRNYLAGAHYWSWRIEVDPLASLQRLKASLEQDREAIAEFACTRLTLEDEEPLPGYQTQCEDVDLGTPDIRSETPPPPTKLAYPLPAADPEIPQGQVRLESRFYIERVPYEAQCYEEIGRAGALIRIKAPRQMGKTSLMARILNRADERGYRAIPISFQHADRATFADLGSLLRWFCAIVARRLHLPHRLEDYWDDIFGSKGNCTSYFKEYLLPAIESPLVLGLDEVDKVFQYPIIADDFFGMLRAWYEEGSYGSSDSELWERLRLVIVHSTEVYLPLDVNQSPFNVGLPIELPEFTPEQVTDLVNLHGLKLTAADIQALMALIGGHPYLVRLALYHLALNQLTLAELYEFGPTEAGIYGDHLRRHLLHLKQNAELAEAYRAILDASAPLPLDSERMFKLHSLGLVHLQGNGAAPSFELYRRYFSDRLNVSSS